MLKLVSLIGRARRAPPWAADAALAGGIFAIGVVELVFFAGPAPPFRLALVWSIPAFAAMSLPLAVRRRNLWLCYLLVETAAVIAAQTHLVVVLGLGSELVFTVLLYSVGEQTSGPVTAALLLGQVGYYYSLEFEVPGAGRDASPLLYNVQRYLPPFGLAALAGWAQRRRRRLTEELRARVVEVERERELLAGQAVAQERVRIARELRALVIQGVSRMTSIARAARDDVGEAPDRAQAEIAALERVGRGTLVEMRRLLGVLRRADQATDYRPDFNTLAAWSPEGLSAPTGEQPAPELIDRFRGLPARRWLADAAIAAAIAGLAVREFVSADPQDALFSGWVPRGLMATIVLAVLLRRTAPFTMLSVIASCEFVWILLRHNAPESADRALLIGVYTVGAHKDIGWTVAAVGMGLYAWSLLPALYRCICLIDIGTLSVFAVIAGHSMLVSRATNRELQEQTDLLQRTRQERVRLVVAEERTRVARDMHDVVAHAVTGMVVQGGGARMVAADDPRLAEAMLQDIRQIGLQALEELRALAETLDPSRLQAEEELREGAPDLGSLIERARRGGQEIALTEEGEARDDQGIRISLYRIVQEALTNARKHAPGAHTVVTIRHLPRVVEVEVRNGASGARQHPAAWLGAGHGLIGISERAAVFGGTAESGPTSDGGFRVYARLPRELALV
jgi:signal transduction histidine kinase